MSRKPKNYEKPFFTGLRQERPPHLRDGLHPAMRERGRAIPDTQTIPIIERQKYPPPKIVEGRVSVKNRINHEQKHRETVFQVQEEVIFFEKLFLDAMPNQKSKQPFNAVRTINIFYVFFSRGQYLECVHRWEREA